MAQRPRTLQPELSPAHLFGARLRTLREDHGLSQSALGHIVFCSGHLIGKIEKGDRRAQPDLVQRCDVALGAQGTLLALGRALGRDDHPAKSSSSNAILDCLPLLRRALDAYDMPEDGPVRPLADLRGEVQQLVGWRLNSNYADLAQHLPVLLPELHRAVRSTHDPESAKLLTQAYRAADAIADKFGLHDLSARIIELMRATAVESADPLTVAAVEYVRAETFFANGDAAAGRRMLDRAAAAIEVGGSPAAGATYGTLHMRAAVLAAREGNADAASGHIAEAAIAARDVPEGVYRGTAFGPASVRIHRLSLALDSDDIVAALAATEGWIPPSTVPAERRSHFFVDLARTQVHAGRSETAVESLHVARRIAPQHVRHHAEVKTTLALLLARTPRPSQPLLGMARWVGVLPEIN